MVKVIKRVRLDGVKAKILRPFLEDACLKEVASFVAISSLKS